MCLASLLRFMTRKTRAEILLTRRRHQKLLRPVSWKNWDCLKEAKLRLGKLNRWLIPRIPRAKDRNPLRTKVQQHRSTLVEWGNRTQRRAQNIATFTWVAQAWRNPLPTKNPLATPRPKHLPSTLQGKSRSLRNTQKLTPSPRKMILLLFTSQSKNAQQQRTQVCTKKCHKTEFRGSSQENMNIRANLTIKSQAPNISPDTRTQNLPHSLCSRQSKKSSTTLIEGN